MTLSSLLLLGLLLGMKHATEPDHVVAVATIVARERSLRSAGRVGLLWGAGHTLTVLVVGGAIVVFGLVVPARLGLSLEFAVAVMLVLLGVRNVVNFLRDRPVVHSHLHIHPHRHSPKHSLVRGQGLRPRVGDPHTHKHAHTMREDEPGRPSRGGLPLRSLVIGVVHGLAGSAAVALLVLTTIRSPAWAVLYLALFGLGTCVGMMLITMVMATPLMILSRRSGALQRHLGWMSGLLSVGFGLFLVYEIGFVDGLFSAHPHWEPR